jgi:hypothetical protein
MWCATDPRRQRERRSHHAIHPGKTSVEAEIYRGSNGDVWYLVSDVEAERFLVRHRLNRSGGKSSLVDIESFLSEQPGPQHEALQHLLRDMGYLLPGS